MCVTKWEQQRGDTKALEEKPSRAALQNNYVTSKDMDKEWSKEAVPKVQLTMVRIQVARAEKRQEIVAEEFDVDDEERDK